MRPMKKFDAKGVAVASILMVLGMLAPAGAQEPPSIDFRSSDGAVSLEEVLIVKLRAFDPDQRGFVRRVVRHVEQAQLEPTLVLAIHRYAVRRHPRFPFPYFERAMRFEAGKRGITLPPARLIATTPGDATLLY